MTSKDDMKNWDLCALKSLGGKGWPKDVEGVAKFIWKNYKLELRSSGRLLYTWQYDMRRTAQSLRNVVIRKPAHSCQDLPWEVA